MDYYVWGAVEKEAYRCTSTTKSQLIDRIRAVFAPFPGKVLHQLAPGSGAALWLYAIGGYLG